MADIRDLYAHLLHAAIKPADGDIIIASRQAFGLGVLLERDYPEIAAVILVSDGVPLDTMQSAVARAVEMWREQSA